MVAELAERQADERVAVVERTGVPDHPQRHSASRGTIAEDGVAQLGHARSAVVDDLVAGGAGDPVDEVAIGVVAAGVLGGGVGGQVRLGAGGPGFEGVAAAGTATVSCWVAEPYSSGSPVNVNGLIGSSPRSHWVVRWPSANGKKMRSRDSARRWRVFLADAGE